MRIAEVAPLAESVPPRLYGGTERVVSWLTDALLDLNCSVTLFASGDSKLVLASLRFALKRFGFLNRRSTRRSRRRP